MAALRPVGLCGSAQRPHQTDYLYESSITPDRQRTLDQTGRYRFREIGLAEGSGVIDIGSNDGTLLSKFAALGMNVHRIDPCAEIADIAIGEGIPTDQRFPLRQSAPARDGKICPARTSSQGRMSSRIDDLEAILRAVSDNIGNGVFVFESPYFGDFYETFSTTRSTTSISLICRCDR